MAATEGRGSIRREKQKESERGKGERENKQLLGLFYSPFL